jgi:hypothetical protein
MKCLPTSSLSQYLPADTKFLFPCVFTYFYIVISMYPSFLEYQPIEFELLEPILHLQLFERANSILCEQVLTGSARMFGGFSASAHIVV